MNVTLTGATGLIGAGIVRALLARGDSVTVLSRDPERARATLPGVEAHAWRLDEPAPAAALNGRDGVVHLAGESVAQRWTDASRRAIHDSRETGTRNLVAGLAAAEPRPRVLVSASGMNYYGPRGDEPITEDAAPGDDFLAHVCVAWEREAAAARELGLRVATLRTAVVLDKDGGALSKMLPFFRL
ncbi:MAG TPA: NAD-dependent epimerase/dehydratase family protein, partial [Solirubrobacteraceae bacterium]|nr:NAD-dependent epimerase/dehydratase family protein [Solirubrobacteraceae bacterium]